MKLSKRSFLLLALALIATFAFTFSAAAQEETPAEEAPAAEVSGEAAAEGEAVAEGEAAAEEAAPATNPLTPLGINTGFLLAQIANFLLIFGLLTVFLWRPMMNMLDNRAAKIQKGLEDAAAAANARRNAEADASKVLEEAKRQAALLIEEARVRGEEVGKVAATAAQAEADSIRADARVRAEEEVNRRLADLRGQVAAISVALSERLIGSGLDERRQQALVSDFFAKVPQGALSMAGDVEVVSAMPLSDAEKAKVQQETGAASVNFAVDPNILGGLIVRSADKVVDGSVRNSLGDLASRLR
ncbi:MAG: F0F1 ATP synthase subunit B [Pleurocapsa minor GSE-CHR-MK-17-07R]|jgi:F-type H+-transporting ATPase subunit b|nr:F0F1 ATP synthase subunit B [Pleurocapsa minor GSE-CHR-MK 17-07R]